VAGRPGWGAQSGGVEAAAAQGVAGGARLACGGTRPPHLARGYFVEPTLFTGVRNDMTVAREEIFGPVISAIPFADEAEAIALANDSDYGLYGYVWTGDTERGIRVARAIRTGTVQVNGSPLNAGARHTIDAAGLVVMPGIIDAHTHYDPQLSFDPYATSSCFHGVTSVVAGNCGYSIAPCHAEDHEWLTELFAKVEGMSPSVLRE